jgi:activator of HSP90 ATPase
MKSIYKKYTIAAPVSEVWRALVDPEYIDDWGAGKAHMDDTNGYEFSLWNGDIYGTNIEVIQEKIGSLLSEIINWEIQKSLKKWVLKKDLLIFHH